MKQVILVLVVTVLSLSIRVTIDDFGAVRNKDYLGAHLTNQKALYSALKAVNTSNDTVR